MTTANNSSVKRVLVVGSWAKEQISIENLSGNPKVEIFSYMDTRNPGIIPQVKGYHIGSFKDIHSIVRYAKEQEIDLVIITTASPLSMGLVDALEAGRILTFGPVRLAARLESDKEFTRRLLQKYMPSAVPQFEVFEDTRSAIEYAEKLNWQVAVKPIGLTEGLGVRVFGEQLKDENDVKEYIRQVINNRIGGSARVIIEEKLEGEEFTVQCFVHGKYILSTPAVQDFKKLLPGERGPNTASMGSYSQQGHLLPFMEEEDYEKALEIIRETLEGFQKETGKTCSGFLYGQFMLTASGVKLIEYNFRPGDPEWINTIMILKNNLLDIIMGLFQGEEQELYFENQATVCKYVVPEGYPERLDLNLDVNLNEEAIRKIQGLKYYYSCGLDNKGKLNVGTERGIAFVARAPTIEEANERVERAISLVDGEFYYRKDIGTKDLIDSKVEHVNRLRRSR
ncbi:MAG: phosphoribosylamine--glycine ligase [Candidatus Methanoperedens nitroreducens]|uniref:phosphoribosylamine--glycine ligase n=1 Tax=Candidatus Methanoperedens nitratireducens TaxID=1392998 RepID=A0A0N8KQT8_9EURY|nr:phosphoribosylamine--glycine ligase [Candidatus Methanoperedens sp. BLZ2]KAB2948003.1 MAG: phosphoribosylamine--glycine ligase [Candidatus Methanoperedens sp.]KPQ43058.1 MAG: phosphoribosylamine--glycine ligase [Candidatus Methanoperedens sp. BLZ1]MBZ0176340.1 phosphoribosylamine--glycine ligase [Candidatus Methanoperedens nitroreducens]CAG0958937.1 phosphoribosylamine---glycine ligase [Methanosarcinales archaeon]MCX9080181.1 phosphoribosylamine--glycine ligase [Candidatus Methanoperedens s